MKKNYLKWLFAVAIFFSFSINHVYSQFGCGSAIPITNGYTQTGITTPGTGGVEDWNTNPTGTSESEFYWDDDVYLFEYTSGATTEEISMTINSNNAWNGIGIFDDCSGTTFSNELDADAATTAGTRTVTAVIAPGNTVYIAVGQWGAPNDLDFDVTSFTVTTITCADPINLGATNFTPTSADLTWTDITGGNANNFEIELGTAGFTPTGTATNTSPSSPLNVNTLSANTTYDYYLRADCGSGDFSNWVGPFQFSTPCNAVVAPWSEDFENAGSIPNCWAQGISNSEDWIFDDAAGVTGQHVGNNGTLGGTTTSAGFFAWVDDSSPHNTGTTLESPMIDVSALTNPELTFFAISDNEGETNVEFSIDVWDGSSWNTGFYTRNTNTLNGEWEQIAVSLASLTITGDIQLRFIVDENNGTDFDDDIAIDDIDLHDGPSCPSPSNLTLLNLNSNSVEFSWNLGSSESDWNFEYGPQGFTQGTGTIEPTSSNPYTINGLTSQTTYDFYIQADCGGGDLSTWYGPYTITTPCNAFTATYTQDFDGAPAVIPFAGINCWTTTGSGAVDIDLVDATDDGEPIPSAPNAVELNDGNLGTQDTAILVSPSFSDLSSGANRIRIMAHQENPTLAFANLYIGVMSDPNDVNTFVMYDSITKAEFEAVPGFNEHTIYFNNTALIGSNTHIAFMHGDDTYEVYIDDFIYEPSPSCIEPTTLSADNVTGNSVELSWTDINSSTPAGWNIEYGPAGFTQGTGTIEPAASSPHTINGLSAQTAYDFYIQSDCGGGDFSIWYGPISVTTPCNAFVAPYLQQYDTDVLPNCWDENGDNDWEYGNDVSNPTGFADYGAANIPDHSNNNGTFIGMDGSDNGNGEVSYLYSPQIDVSALTTTEIRYYVFSNNVDDAAQNKLIVEYNNGSGWIALDSIQDNLGNDWSERVFYESGLTGNLQVRFEITGDNSLGGSTFNNDILIDDFEVKEAPSCLPILDLAVANITETTVEVSWTTQGSGTSWNIEYGPAGYTPGTGTSINTTNNPETLTGLIDNTEYDVYVQADCGGGDLSTWTGPANFTTDIFCSAPIAVQLLGGTSGTQVELGWNTTGTETDWIIEYGPTGFTPGAGNGTSVNTNTIPTTITGLMPGVVYDFYVQADCGSGQNNPFGGPATYAVPISNDAACDAVQVPVDGSTTTYINDGATLQTGELTALGDNTVWFMFDAPASGHVEIRTCGNDFDNFIEVYELTDCADFTTFSLVDAATDNPFATCSGTIDPAGLNLCGLTAGNTYYLAVGSESAGNTGAFPLTLTEIPNVTAGTGTTSQVCAGDTVTLANALSGADAGGTWSEIDMSGGLLPGGLFSTNNLAYVNYRVEYKVENVCEADSVNVTVAIAGPSQAGQDGTLADCNVLTDFYLYDGLSGNVDFGGTWVDVDVTGRLNGSVFSPDSLAAGTYQFDYITTNGVCPADTSTVEVTIQDCLGTEDFTAESFKIFPNPTQGIFYIVSSVNAQDAIVEIMDLQGKVISSQQMNINAGAQYDFDLSQLERGVYLIKVATQENNTVKRVVLQR